MSSDPIIKRDIKIGDKFKSRNGQIGTIENINSVPMLVVRDKGKVTQTIVLRKIDITKFEKVGQ